MKGKELILKRNKVLHIIRKNSAKLQNEEVVKIADDIEDSHDKSRDLFKATKPINLRKLENIKFDTMTANLYYNEVEIAKSISRSFKDIFQNQASNLIIDFSRRTKSSRHMSWHQRS